MAARQPRTMFLDAWLSDKAGFPSDVATPSPSARSIIQSWSDLRECLMLRSFEPHRRLLESLRNLVNSQSTLHVADPQAKILLSILGDENIDLPDESYPLFLRLLYIWLRKSFRPSPAAIASAVEVICKVLSGRREWGEHPLLFSEGVLILGAFSSGPAASPNSIGKCLDLLCRMLDEGYGVMRLVEGVIPSVLAGIGYALASSTTASACYGRILGVLFGVWGKEDGPCGSVRCGLIILHLVEWVTAGHINSNSFEKILMFSRNVFERSDKGHSPFSLVMGAGGLLRASKGVALNDAGMKVILAARAAAEDRIEDLAKYLNVRFAGSDGFLHNSIDKLHLQCFALSLARSGSVTARGPFLLCLASALLNEAFPLKHLYDGVLGALSGSGISTVSTHSVRPHLDSVLFKEGGTITGVLCNLYGSADENSRKYVERMMWDYCRDIYSGHRMVGLVLKGNNEELMENLEKISESAFLMVVVFSLAVTKAKLNSKYPVDVQMDVSVQILIAFSCMEYFRRMRLAEYLDTIRAVIANVQENMSASVSFVESMPSYTDLTKGSGTTYQWYTDEVQTARILFYLRVVPTCIEQLPCDVFRKFIVATMFLYMAHPNQKVARASHTLFSAFVSSDKESSNGERISLKEQLAFYYVERSLEDFPGVTPFEGLASGVAALVRHLPAGSPAILYSIHALADKASSLCLNNSNKESNMWKNLNEEPCKKLLDLLLSLLSLVDIQVLPDLMKLLAQLVVQLPSDGQTMILNYLYAIVAESDDLTRKPTLVSWLQSLSYICSQNNSSSNQNHKASPRRNGLLSWIARL
ncbi:hypothetical protein MLD38_018434 [Melastoma candidum]|uniref:Uncharacterized protein n=1 Tax=Melastoma candidum TaxID=119954 RepID=A0ACB9QT87_9MYRT|nr:hypothetical protein MLD38_018434 [Melastoma candidum]